MRVGCPIIVAVAVVGLGAHGQEPLAKALFAINLLHGLRGFFDSDTESEIRKELAEWVDYFESEAIKMLVSCVLRFKSTPDFKGELCLGR